MYAIGEKIVYPMHGAGYIENIETKHFGDKDLDYYAVHIINGNISLSLPVENKAEIHLRPISETAQAEKVLNDFQTQEINTDIVWNKRYQLNMERLKQGDIENVALVVKELMVRDATNGLSTGDRKMLILSRNILVTELSLILNREPGELADFLLNTIQQKLKSTNE